MEEIDIPDDADLKVIPADILEALKAENAKLREALEFYAEHENMPLANDNGETARKALGRE